MVVMRSIDGGLSSETSYYSSIPTPIRPIKQVAALKFKINGNSQNDSNSNHRTELVQQAIDAFRKENNNFHKFTNEHPTEDTESVTVPYEVLLSAPVGDGQTSLLTSSDGTRTISSPSQQQHSSWGVPYDKKRHSQERTIADQVDMVKAADALLKDPTAIARCQKAMLLGEAYNTSVYDIMKDSNRTLKVDNTTDSCTI